MKNIDSNVIKNHILNNDTFKISRKYIYMYLIFISMYLIFLLVRIYIYKQSIKF